MSSAVQLLDAAGRRRAVRGIAIARLPTAAGPTRSPKSARGPNSAAGAEATIGSDRPARDFPVVIDRADVR